MRSLAKGVGAEGAGGARTTPASPDAPTLPMSGVTEGSGGLVLVTPPGSAPGGTDRLRELVSREERLAWHRRLVRAATIGLGGWIAFLALDAIVVFGLGDALPLPYLAVRIVSAIALAITILVFRRIDDPEVWLLRAFEVAAFAAGAVCCAIHGALHADGLGSHPIPGAMLIVLAYGVMLGSPWRRALLPVAAMTLAIPATLGVAALFSPRIAAQWSDRSAVLEFGTHYALVLGAAGLTLIGGQALAGLRQQVAEARSIGRYRLRRRIASGGMGEVWAAYHASLGRDVAVKLIRIGRAGDDEIRRFEVEVRATAELTHPNTVRVFDYGVTEDGLWYYAMELLDAESIEQIVQREGALEPRRAVRLITQAAQALGEAHGRGIVHRDVKPANLLVQRAGSGSEYVKLIDFGIARLIDAGRRMTHTGLVLGTPGYIAPEVVGGGAAGPRADVYALGAVLYFALAGRMPFQANDARSLVLAHLHADVPALPANVPDGLRAIVGRCLQKDPDARFEDGDDLARALLEHEV